MSLAYLLLRNMKKWLSVQHATTTLFSLSPTFFSRGTRLTRLRTNSSNLGTSHWRSRMLLPDLLHCFLIISTDETVQGGHWLVKHATTRLTSLPPTCYNKVTSLWQPGTTPPLDLPASLLLFSAYEPDLHFLLIISTEQPMTGSPAWYHLTY